MMLPVPGEIFELEAPKKTLQDFLGLSPLKWACPALREVCATKGRFVLVPEARFNRQKSISAVRMDLATQGTIPEGHWVVSFYEKYGREKASQFIGIPDPSWINSADESYFPCRLPTGDVLLKPRNSDRIGDWLWLVQVVQSVVAQQKQVTEVQDAIEAARRLGWATHWVADGEEAPTGSIAIFTNAGAGGWTRSARQEILIPSGPHRMTFPQMMQMVHTVLAPRRVGRYGHDSALIPETPGAEKMSMGDESFTG